MAAGLGFKDFVTGEVLTAADVDGYLMQGVWVFASAAARDAAVTSPQEGNFAYLKDTNVTTYYTGSAWANLDTTGMTNPMTTTGDTIYSSSGSTPARLGIGSTGDVLTVAGGVPSWAAPAGGSGMTLLNGPSGTTLSGASTTITWSGTYNYLYGVVYGVTNATSNNSLYILPNNVNNLCNGTGTARYTGSANNLRVEGFSDGRLDLTRGYDTLRTSADNAWQFEFHNYASSSNYKPFRYSGIYIDNDSTKSVVNFGGGFQSNTAITSLVFVTAGGNASSGTVLLYGVK
jgi:hypothetical protein